MRKGRDSKARCLVVVNFTPEVRHDYRVPVPFSCNWREALNTDAGIYGGSNVGNAGVVQAIEHGDHAEIRLTLPPLAALFLVPEI